MTFTTESLAGFLDHELTRAIERLRDAVRHLNREIEQLKAERARRKERRKEERR